MITGDDTAWNGLDWMGLKGTVAVFVVTVTNVGFPQ
jgi:hypothetical protein